MGPSDIRECTECGRRFPTRRGAPVLFPEGFDHPAGDVGAFRRGYHAILAHPSVYDRAQRYGGGRPIAAQVQKALADVGDATVLDLGAGTGMVGSVLPPEASYIWLDNDALKLDGFLAKGASGTAVLGDAAHLPFRDHSVDVVTMVEVSHHLDDEALDRCLIEAARVTRERFVLVDGLRSLRLRSRLLWALDLGRHPRTDTELRSALEGHFTVTRETRFRVNHDHIIYACAR